MDDGRPAEQPKPVQIITIPDPTPDSHLSIQIAYGGQKDNKDAVAVSVLDEKGDIKDNETLKEDLSEGVNDYGTMQKKLVDLSDDKKKLLFSAVKDDWKPTFTALATDGTLPLTADEYIEASAKIMGWDSTKPDDSRKAGVGITPSSIKGQFKADGLDWKDRSKAKAFYDKLSSDAVDGHIPNDGNPAMRAAIEAAKNPSLLSDGNDAVDQFLKLTAQAVTGKDDATEDTLKLSSQDKHQLQTIFTSDSKAPAQLNGINEQLKKILKDEDGGYAAWKQNAVSVDGGETGREHRLVEAYKIADAINQNAHDRDNNNNFWQRSSQALDLLAQSAANSKDLETAKVFATANALLQQVPSHQWGINGHRTIDIKQQNDGTDPNRNPIQEQRDAQAKAEAAIDAKYNKQADAAPSAAPPASAPAATPVTTYGNIREAVAGAKTATEVALNLQTFLKQKNIDIAADGKFGPKTREGLAKYLENTGDPGNAKLNADTNAGMNTELPGGLARAIKIKGKYNNNALVRFLKDTDLMDKDQPVTPDPAADIHHDSKRHAKVSGTHGQRRAHNETRHDTVDRALASKEATRAGREALAAVDAHRAIDANWNGHAVQTQATGTPSAQTRTIAGIEQKDLPPAPPTAAATSQPNVTPPPGPPPPPPPAGSAPGYGTPPEAAATDPGGHGWATPGAKADTVVCDTIGNVMSCVAAQNGRVVGRYSSLNPNGSPPPQPPPGAVTPAPGTYYGMQITPPVAAAPPPPPPASAFTGNRDSVAVLDVYGRAYRVTAPVNGFCPAGSRLAPVSGVNPHAPYRDVLACVAPTSQFDYVKKDAGDILTGLFTFPSRAAHSFFDTPK